MVGNGMVSNSTSFMNCARVKSYFSNLGQYRKQYSGVNTTCELYKNQATMELCCGADLCNTSGAPVHSVMLTFVGCLLLGLAFM